MNRFLAQCISVAGHPLFVLTYVLLLMMLTNPYAFGVSRIGEARSVLLLVYVFVCTLLIPGFAVLMMKSLGLIKSLEMEDKQERIGPYIVAGVFYLWLLKNLLSGGQAPRLYVECVLGATIGLFFAFFINIFTKISAHATGMGGFVVMLVAMAFEWQTMPTAAPFSGGSLWFSPPLIVAFGVIAAGLVGTARLALRAHVPADLYRGYAAGVAAMLLARAFV